MIGTVDKVEFTRSSLGNQFTTIDGVRYTTWWDIHHVIVREGAIVEYEPYDGVVNMNGIEIKYVGARIMSSSIKP